MSIGHNRDWSLLLSFNDFDLDILVPLSNFFRAIKINVRANTVFLAKLPLTFVVNEIVQQKPSETMEQPIFELSLIHTVGVMAKSADPMSLSLFHLTNVYLVLRDILVKLVSSRTPQF
jgi:hypothetical protein